MKVSIHTASHIDTRLAVARVGIGTGLGLELGLGLGLAIARPAVCIINLEWLYTQLRAKLAVCTHGYVRAKLAVCIASAVSRCGYHTKMSILGESSILNTQKIYNCEHSETLTGTLSLLNLGN